MRSPIIVHLNACDMPDPAEFESWAAWVFRKLRVAGIPANADGTVEEGTLRRFDDPKSWSTTIYEWRPDGYPEQ